MGFLTQDDAPIIWRGPMLHGALQQFFREVRWVDLDYLVVDLPPGTGDVALSLSQTVPIAGAIVVTTPQQVSLADSRRAVAMYKKLNIPPLGVIENMSYFICPNCSHDADIFGQRRRRADGAGARRAVSRTHSDLSADSRRQRRRRAARSSASRSSPAALAFIGAAEQTAAQVSIASYSRPTIPLDVVPMNIPFVKHTLSNGLDVLLASGSRLPDRRGERLVSRRLEERAAGPDRVRASVRAFDVRGLAASRHRVFPPLQGAGGSLNGSTNADRTNYWEVVPSNALELALWMESDRMGYLLPALTDAKFANQRDVVLNERRQNYENRPYGLAPMVMLAALCIRPSSVSLDDDRRNRRSACGAARRRAAVLHAPTTTRRTRRSSLAGDIDLDGALALAETYFGELPAGPSIDAGQARDAAARVGETRLLPRGSCRAAAPLPGVADDARCSRRGMPISTSPPTSWRTARPRGCTGGWSSRSGLRPTSRPAQNSREIAGFVQIAATAAPGHSLAEIDAIDRRGDRQKLASDGPTEDEDRARPRAVRGAVHVPAADGRRLRRQVGSAECLQHRSSATRASSIATWRATGT